MRIPRRLAALLTATIVGVGAATIVGQDVALRLQWTEGETLTYRSTEESTVLMSGLPGMGDMTVTNVVSQVQQLTAEEVADDGAATLRVTFESMKMNVSSPQGSMSYDSADPSAASGDPAAAQVAQAMGALVGQSIGAVISSNGAVVSVSGASAILNELTANSPQLAQALSQLGGMDQMMTDDGMKAVLGQQFAFLPSESVAVGDTWELEAKVPNPMGEMTISSVLTLKGVETIEGREIARIGTTQGIAVAPGGMMGMMSVEVYDAYGEGEVLFDRQRGQIFRVTNHVTLPMALTMAAPDGSTLNIDAITNATSTLEIVER